MGRVHFYLTPGRSWALHLLVGNHLLLEKDSDIPCTYGGCWVPEHMQSMLPSLAGGRS